MSRPTRIGRLGLLVGAVASLGYSNGPPDHMAGDPPDEYDCTVCHSNFPVNSGDGILSLEGVPAGYSPGASYLLTVRLTDPGQSRWGFEVTALDPDGNEGGVLVATSDSVQVSGDPSDGERDYLKHTLLGTRPGTASGRWLVGWDAPPVDVGPVTFYLAGNATNDNGSTAGDYVYTVVATTDGTVGVAPVAAVAPTLRAIPNPLRAGREGVVLVGSRVGEWVQVFDASGRQLQAMRIGSGPDAARITLGDLAPGRYFLRVESPGGRVRVAPVTLLP